LRILHTSDWHLGRSLYGRKRLEEFSAFLDWLIQTIQSERIDILLVAGDVFDTIAPGNKVQELYYSFLTKMVVSCCQHVVIIAGNHDSASFLEAPKEILQCLHIHVVGSVPTDPQDEVLLLEDRQGQPLAVICAVPYLHDRDVRLSETTDSIDGKTEKLVDGICQHYAGIGAIAERKCQETGGRVPIIGMGHLFTTGGKTTEGDGVRDLYVGSLAQVGQEAFPSCFDYLALGHLHVPQKVAGQEHLRYCGSPLPMGFGEARQQKEVVVVEFSTNRASCVVHPLQVPCFQKLEQLEGDLTAILSRLSWLKEHGEHIWLEIEYTGEALVENLRELLEQAVEGTQLEILRIKNNRIVEMALHRLDEEDLLENLDVKEVFQRCLDYQRIEEADRPPLISAYDEIVFAMHGQNGDQPPKEDRL